MCYEIQTDNGEIEIETINHYNNEGLEELVLMLNTEYGFSMIYLNEEKAKELGDILLKWSDRS